MTSPRSEFLHVMTERGFIKDCTDLAGLDSALYSGELSAYIGFDCTAASLHIGSLSQIMKLRWLQKTGNRPIVLMGGGTTRIGDPSGRDETRQIMTMETIEFNKQSIFKVFQKYLRFDDTKTGAKMVDNSDWLLSWNYIDFLREIGPHFTINRMLSFESVRQRLDREQPLTFIEFNYMLLQAYDFYELSKKEDVRLQMGGSDQWGNIVNGIELTRRLGGAELFGITSPLMVTSDGKKMGKTAQGAVWLNADMRSPYEFWQYWRNVTDSDVGKFLKIFTELPLDEVNRLVALGGSEINEAKKILANEVTTLCHGAEEAQKAAQTARLTFEQGAAQTADLPKVFLNEQAIHETINMAQLFVKAGLAKSGKDAKRLIAENGAKLNDVTVTDWAQQLSITQFEQNRIKLSAGKKRHVLVMIAPSRDT